MKRAALKRKPKKRGNGYGHDPLPGQHFKRSVCRRPCVMCVLRPPTVEQRASHGPELAILEAHHVVPRRTLKSLGHGTNRVLWAVENGMCLCRFHHARHETFTQRVPRALLTNDNVDFASNLGLEWALEKEYPT